MNFWKRYPADYQRKTARLTLAQHGAYTLLLDELYTNEAPLPPEIAELYRICRAMSKPEQEAVRVVADRFFPINGDGQRHNKRASEELEEAAPAVQAARANGKKGGRPKKPKEPTGLRKDPSIENPVGNPMGSETETQAVLKSITTRARVAQSSEREEEPPWRGVPGAAKPLRPSKKCPSGFEVTPELRQWAVEQTPGVNVDRETAVFLDYTFATAATDWPGRWRNWMRKATGFAAGKRPNDDPFKGAI